MRVPELESVFSRKNIYGQPTQNASTRIPEGQTNQTLCAQISLPPRPQMTKLSDIVFIPRQWADGERSVLKFGNNGKSI